MAEARHDAELAATSVAIVGTGFAGLTTAHLLCSDDQGRYDVTLFEQADSLSLDAASAAVRHDKTGAVERIDMPMRACAGGYYANLLRMYDYLAIPLHPVRFLFVFAAAAAGQLCEAARPDDAGAAPGSYFVHASNLHRVPPPRPAGRGALPHLAEALFLLVCHFWFTAACFLVPARPRGEALADYLARTWLPRRYVSHYLLPLLSSVSTCTHAELLAFPASDVIAYKKLSHGQQHFAVCGGVHQVQSRLAKGVDDIRLACTVTAVEARKDGLLVRWQPTGGPGRPRASEQRFDRVVLAVSPDVAARLFRPLAAALGKMPTRRVESSIRSPRPGAFSLAAANESAAAAACSHHRGSSWPAQVITFRTLFAGDESRTQAVHAMPSGVLVSTSPLEAAADPKAVLRTASFTRTLRTPESRATVQSIMGHGRWQDGAGDVAWVNGQDNLWLAGSWCWDGMVLLEGCVVSAMRVARDFGVRVPWREE